MNKYSVSTFAFLMLAGASAPAAAFTNQIDLLQPTDDNNIAEIAITGDNNTLTIDQLHDGAGGANSLNIEIVGDNNGAGSTGNWYSPLPISVGLRPGTITQSGHENLIDLKIFGSNNLFAAVQQGSNNSISGLVNGSNNQAAAVQVGHGNMLAFSQTGQGNSIAVFQKSW